MCNDPNVTERKSAPLLDNRQNKGDRDRSPVGTKEIKRIANNARFAAGGQCDQCAGLLVGYSCSLAFLRWRRLISPSSAETINCPVLSPSSFKFSTASAIAWGTRASSFLDFPLTAFVAISDFLVIRWLTVYTQENRKTLLTWLTPVTSIVADTFVEVIDEKTKPAGATNTNGLLTTNDSESIEVAMRNYTRHPQGRDSHNLNKYIWRFIALSTAQPRVIHIEAASEQEARQQSPAGCVMVFTARIRQGEYYA
ncbi:host cell division inhibitor Icd-like protein [Escherichia coli]|nr:host cell division inhibitor Icd-like protein [Escherichia coli]MDN1902295.1 host cell division inhibitor Icd-like protein [Escherichia coli]